MGVFGKKDPEKGGSDSDGLEPAVTNDVQEGMFADNADNLQRHLNNRQIQLIAIGGAIGTALFVSIGSGLYHGGPGSLLIAYTIQCLILAAVTNGLAEMSTAYPVAGGFIRLAGKWVDDALGFATGWNFFLYEALLIPFEISAFCLVTQFWSPAVAEPGPTAGIVAGMIVCYAAINILAVDAYGEAEFWLSGGKVILIFALFFFTFITMVGGNPQGDAYGFRYYTDGRAFQPAFGTDALARFQGFIYAMSSAAFTVVGPEYISMVAAEAKRPRTYIKNAFKTVYVRFAIFFFGGAFFVGVVCSSRDPQLVNVVTGEGAHGAAASPYVIAMNNLNIKIFPHIVNALLLTSIFSAGNTYTYCAVRNLYGLSLEGRAPRFLSYTTRKGVPLYCFIVVMIFPILAFLQVGSSSSVVITWFVNLVTAGGLMDYISICITYICFHRACKAQGLDRRQFSYFAHFQPFCAWLGLVWMSLLCLYYGFSAFKPFTVSGFFQTYTMQILMPLLYIGWKIIKRTKFIGPYEADLVWERPTIDAYEATFLDPPTSFWKEMLAMVGIGRKKGGSDQRKGSITAIQRQGRASVS